MVSKARHSTEQQRPRNYEERCRPRRYRCRQPERCSELCVAESDPAGESEHDVHAERNATGEGGSGDHCGSMLDDRSNDHLYGSSDEHGKDEPVRDGQRLDVVSSDEAPTSGNRHG